MRRERYYLEDWQSPQDSNFRDSWNDSTPEEKLEWLLNKLTPLLNSLK